jgi:hypothetical protein
LKLKALQGQQIYGSREEMAYDLVKFNGAGMMDKIGL